MCTILCTLVYTGFSHDFNNNRNHGALLTCHPHSPIFAQFKQSLPGDNIPVSHQRVSWGTSHWTQHLFGPHNYIHNSPYMSLFTHLGKQRLVRRSTFPKSDCLSPLVREGVVTFLCRPGQDDSRLYSVDC